MVSAGSRRAWVLGIVVAVTLMVSVAVRADDEATLRHLQSRLEALERKLQQLPPPAPNVPRSTSEQIRDLLDRIEKLERAAKRESEKGEQNDTKETAKPDRKPGEEWVEVGKDRALSKSLWSEGVLLESSDGAFRLHPGGRLDFDNSWYRSDPSLPFLIDDGTAFRRARFRFDGTLWELIDFATEVNFANIQDINSTNATVPVGSVGLRDFWVQFREVPLVGHVRVGHLKPPISLERMTSSNHFYYMERSPGHDAFLNPFEYTNGVMLFDAYLDGRVTAALAFTKVGQSTVNPFGFEAADGQYGVFGRLTALPVYADEGRTLVHVGVGGYHVDPDSNSLAAGDRPLVRAGGGGQIPNLLRTGTFFTAHGVSALNAEAAIVLGPFALSAEYTGAFAPDVYSEFDGVNFSGPRGNAFYQSAYVEAGWFLTPGDYRRYDRKHGRWARTEPIENAFAVRGESGDVCWGRGAVQLLCRYTWLDLASGIPVLTPSSGPGAGHEHDLTLGLAWYLNSQTNVQVNYVYTKLSYVNGTSGDFHGLGCRLHLDF